MTETKFKTKILLKDTLRGMSINDEISIKNRTDRKSVV